MSRALLYSLAGSALIALLLLVASNAGRTADPAFAQVGTIANVSIDVDPANTPANTATSLGTIQTCAQILNDNVLNADEDTTADRVDVDVTVDAVPPAPPDGGLVGFSYVFNLVDFFGDVAHVCDF